MLHAIKRVEKRKRKRGFKSLIYKALQKVDFQVLINQQVKARFTFCRKKSMTYKCIAFCVSCLKSTQSVLKSVFFEKKRKIDLKLLIF